MKIFNNKTLKIWCVLFGILTSGCMNTHQEIRDYYTPTLYEDFKSTSNLPKEQNTVKNEVKKADDIIKKPEWSLQDCINMAIINEDRLKMQGESYYQAKWLYLQALASWLPSVSLLDTRTKYDPKAPDTYENKNDYWLNIRQPIFNAGKEFVGITNADQLKKLREYEFKQYRDLLVLAVADTFYQMLEYKNELDALELLREYTQNHFDMVKAREEAQVARRKDTLLAEASLFDIKARLARAKNIFDNARLNLQLLVGAQLPQKFIDNNSVSELPKDSQQAVAIALLNSNNIRIAEQQIKVSKADVSLAKAAYLPQVNLDWNRYLDMESSSYDGLEWSLILSASLPVDNGGKYGKLQETYSKLRQSQLQKELLVKNIKNDVEKAYKDLQAIRSDIEAREKGYLAAKETADIVSEEYKLGSATNVEVLFVRNAFKQAKISLEKSKLDLKLAYLRLKFTMGLLAKEF
jgi:outer membrane protein